MGGNADRLAEGASLKALDESGALEPLRMCGFKGAMIDYS
jgi:hypothetical protein